MVRVFETMHHRRASRTARSWKTPSVSRTPMSPGYPPPSVKASWSQWALSPVWVQAINCTEYSFDLARSIAHKSGHKSYEDVIADSPVSRFSLADSGILDTWSGKLLVLN